MSTTDQLIVVVSFGTPDREDEVFGSFDNETQRTEWVASMSEPWPDAMFILTKLQHPQAALSAPHGL